MSEPCDDALTSLYLFLDEEMPEAETVRIRQHLADCPPCVGHFEFESRLKRVVRERLAEEVPPDVIDRFRAALRHAGPSSS